MFLRKTVRCPVCKEVLGSLVPKQICSYLCRECGWIFYFDEKGSTLPPEKYVAKVSKKCGCLGCQARDEKARGIS